ncbi:InlB B-repeat-containing protein [Hespellia stercorisuis]|uniref:Listeria/Bacterioides repeat-containing protein n=1 Tax=Hespellia stercorisuis DSM 15480 TaxID=1121950 RepID=A0A1M6W0A1_9FIRM|nr:InlB B-repeat-containing protein [Hespellia stercorisuis]SHK87038.1 Listeria/Bacterioides repeat-containing protein [Hespellia stercorisuis DSM 15480]
MKKILQRSERGVAFLLAMLMAFSSPISVLAANPIITEVKNEGSDLDYTFTENPSEDGTTADIQLEVIEKNGNVLTEVTTPDGTVVYPESKDGKDGFKQSSDGVERNVIHYAASENGKISFNLKYVTQGVADTNQLEIFDSEETEPTNVPVANDLGEENITEVPNKSEENLEEVTPESEQSLEITEPQSEQEQGLLGKAIDTLFPVMEVQAAETDTQLAEKTMEIEYEVTSLNANVLPMQSAKSGGVVTTFEELKTAIGNAGDGEVIRISGTILVPETIRISQNITLEGGKLIKEGNFGLIRVNSNYSLQLTDIVLDGNRDNIEFFTTELVPLVEMRSFSQLVTTGTTILQNNYSSYSGNVYKGSAIGCSGQLKNCKITINEGTIIQNNEIGSGGGAIGIEMVRNCELFINGGEIKNNKAGICGGGIYAPGVVTYLRGGTITGNAAGYAGGTLLTDPIVGGDIKIADNMSLNDGVPDDMYVEATYGELIYLESDFTGQIGIRLDKSVPFPTFQDVVVGDGFDPTASMAENKAGAQANFFSDDPTYITRLEPDGDNHKVVIGFPKVTYDTKSGDFAPGEEQEFYTTANQPITKPSEPTLADHEFVGWYTTSDYQDGTEFDFNTPIIKDTTLYAKWKLNLYTVKFALKDGERGGILEGDTADQSVKYNQYAAAGAQATANVDSAFIGWSYSYTPVGSTTLISGTVMDYTTVPIQNNVTFIANFAKVPFVSGISTNGYVSVQKGGAPADVGTTTVTKIEYDLTDTLPAKAGFKFKGALHYHINEIKLNDSYNHEFTLDLNSTQKQSFTVGEDGHTSTVNITVDKENETLDITGIEESLKFNFIFAEDTKYTVSFKEEKNSTDNFGQNTGLYTGDTMGNAPATNPTKVGYTFDGWSRDGSNAPEKMYDPNAQIKDKDELYYAVWTPKEYTIHYNTDGGTTVPDKTGVYFTDTGLIPTDNPTKNGYTFAGWEKDATTIGTDTAYNTLVVDDTVMEVTLTAKWDVKHFNASWITKDGETLGSIDGGNQTEEGIAYNQNATKDVTATPASNDSEFIGWDYSYIPDGSTTPVTGFTDDYKTIPVLGNITFTAKFALKPFVSIGATNGKVTAIKGTTPEEISGSSGTTALIQYTAAEDIENNKGTVSLKYGADIHHHLSTISFKDTLGHEYTIWTKDGSGITAGPDYEVGNRTPATKVHVTIDERNGVINVSNIDTSLAFTVVFEEDTKYKVEFFRDKDDQSSLMQTNDGLYTGNPVGAKPDPDPTKPGYQFLGWSTDGTNDPDKMYAPDTLIADADIAYYGVWELTDYKLTISKTVDGEHGNKNQDFHFTVTLKDKDGTPLNGTYSYTGDAITGVEKPEDGTVTLDAEGKAEITLKHGQSIVLNGLHIEKQYTVVEKEANQNGYITTATGENNPNITGDSVAAFTNTRTTTPPTGIGPMSHLPTMILGVVILILTCVGLLWSRRRRRA